MSILPVKAAVTIAAAVLLLATGCAPSTPDPTPSPSNPSSSPTPTATAEALSAPQPVLDALCSDILPSSAVGAAYPGGVTEVDLAESIMGADPTISPTYAVQSLGGIACEYSNGEPFSAKRGSNPAYVGVRVVVLPNADSQWNKLIDYYGPDVEGLNCSESEPLFCTFSGFVSGAWIDVTAIGAVSAATVDTLAADAVAAIGAAGKGAGPWAPPVGTTALPADCAGVVSDADVQALLGAPLPVVATLAAGGWSIEAAALENWGGPRCMWRYTDSDFGVGSLQTLPGGAWAWAEAAEFLTVPSAPEELDVTGLAVGDEAWLRCADDGSECLIDLILGGNWLQAHLWADQGERSYDQRAGAEALAAAVVARLG